LHRQRKLDARLQKYYDKLKEIDEISYHLYLVEIYSRQKSKERSKNHLKALLQEVLVNVGDPLLKEKIIAQIEKY